MKVITIIMASLLTSLAHSYECKDPGGNFEVSGLIKTEIHAVSDGNINVTAIFPAIYNDRPLTAGTTLYVIIDKGWQLGTFVPAIKKGNNYQVTFGVNPEFLKNTVLEIGYN